MKTKKAQMEIMGLVIIVILVALGMLFAIKFFVFKEPSETKQKFTYEQQTSNMLSAMLKTNVCKGKETVESLLIDCVEGETIICDDSQSSCEKANETIAIIFSDTLEGPWKQDYEFSVVKKSPSGSLDPDIPFSQFPKNNINMCSGRSKKAAVQPLPIRTGTMVIKLNICSKV